MRLAACGRVVGTQAALALSAQANTTQAAETPAALALVAAPWRHALVSTFALVDYGGPLLGARQQA